MGITQAIASTPGAALDTGIAIAIQMAACGPLSIKATLASAHQVVDPVEADALSKLDAAYTALYRTEDFIEGRRAEAEGRPPKYQGKHEHERDRTIARHIARRARERRRHD